MGKRHRREGRLRCGLAPGRRDVGGLAEPHVSVAGILGGPVAAALVGVEGSRDSGRPLGMDGEPSPKRWTRLCHVSEAAKLEHSALDPWEKTTGSDHFNRL